MEIKIGEEVVVGMIFSQGHVFKGRGVVKAKLSTKSDTKDIKCLVNDQWYEEKQIYPKDIWDKLTERQYI